VTRDLMGKHIRRVFRTRFRKGVVFFKHKRAGKRYLGVTVVQLGMEKGVNRINTSPAIWPGRGSSLGIKLRKG